MAGFIVLEDGRAYASAGWATDAVLRAIAAELQDGDFREWLLLQQREFVGVGMTKVDLREVAPINREPFYQAVRQAIRRAQTQGYEDLTSGSPYYTGWMDSFADLISMIDHWRAGDPPSDFNPHMLDVIPPTGRHTGPGWA